MATIKTNPFPEKKENPFPEQTIIAENPFPKKEITPDMEAFALAQEQGKDVVDVSAQAPAPPDVDQFKAVRKEPVSITPEHEADIRFTEEVMGGTPDEVIMAAVRDPLSAPRGLVETIAVLGQAGVGMPVSVMNYFGELLGEGAGKLVYGGDIDWVELKGEMHRISEFFQLIEPETEFGEKLSAVMAQPFTVGMESLERGAGAVTEDPQKQAMITGLGEAGLVAGLGGRALAKSRSARRRAQKVETALNEATTKAKKDTLKLQEKTVKARQETAIKTETAEKLFKEGKITRKQAQAVFKESLKEDRPVFPEPKIVKKEKRTGEKLDKVIDKEVVDSINRRTDAMDFIKDKTLIEEGRPALLDFKRIKKTHNGAEVKRLLDGHFGHSAVAMFESESFIKKFTDNLTKKEREMIPFIIEKTVEAPNKKMQMWADKAANYFKEGFEFLSKHHDGLNFVDNYVTHIWDIPKGGQGRAVNFFTTKNPYVKKRTIPTLKDGMAAGLKPKTTDIAEVLRVYDNYKIKSVYNQKFVDFLKNMTDEKGNPVVMRIDKAPQDWVMIEHTAFKRAMGISSDPLVLSKVPVKVHPEIAHAVQSVLDSPFNNKGIKGLEMVNAFSKKAMLSASFFHHFALTESAVSVGVLPKTLKKLWNPVRAYNSLKKDGKLPIFENPLLTKDALMHQVELGGIRDAQLGHVKKGLETMERTLREAPVVGDIAGKGMKVVRGANDLWDKGLWDYYYTGLKLMSYEHLVIESIKRNPQKSVKEVKLEVAKFVNDAFGGQKWERLVSSPKYRQSMQLAMLAPDWTVSNIRIAGRGLQGGIQGQLGRRYWLRAALAFYGVSNVFNYALTELHDGEGRFLWDNTVGHNLDIYTGKNRKGEEVYITAGKQFREPFRWIDEPLALLGHKASPIVHMIWEQQAGTTTTGFPLEFKDLPFWDIEGLQQRGISIGAKFVPFSLRGNQVLLAFPTSKGITRYKAKKMYVDAIKDGNIKDVFKVTEALKRNGYTSDQITGIANSATKSVSSRTFSNFRQDFEKALLADHE